MMMMMIIDFLEGVLILFEVTEQEWCVGKYWAKKLVMAQVLLWCLQAVKNFLLLNVQSYLMKVRDDWRNVKLVEVQKGELLEMVLQKWITMQMVVEQELM